MAEKLKCDDTSYIKQLMSNNELQLASDEQARRWIKEEATVWAVVVAPFVLVQGLNNESK